MSHAKSKQGDKVYDSNPPIQTKRVSTALNASIWYALLYLASLLFTNGLADAVHNVLHDVL